MSTASTTTERDTGEVKFFNAEKGFGFCARAGKPDVFVHANELKRSGVEGLLQPGDRLSFDVVPAPGKPGPKGVNFARA